jgi:hypothetical protein
MGGRAETRFELKTTYFDTKINYRLSQKFELGESKFNNLTIIQRKKEKMNSGRVLPLHGWERQTYIIDPS